VILLTKGTHKESQLFTLSVKQLNAIDPIVAGSNDREVAEKVGVERETVTRWRLYHPAFRAELNKRRKEVLESSLDKMRTLVPKSLETIEEVLSDPANPNRWKVAVKFLEIAGISETGLGTIGEDDPEKIVEQAARQERTEQQDPLEQLNRPNDYELSIAISKLVGKLGDSLRDPPDDPQNGKEA
jgi:hypothetical protein